jgi:hypothetical protein
VGLLSIAFYNLRGDTTVPDSVLDSVKLLKKPVEDLLPDLQEPETANADAVQQASLDLEPYNEMQNSRERWNEMRALIEAGQPLTQPLPSEIAISTNPTGRFAPAVPPPPGFTVNLPYESRLTVSGRKTIGMTYRSTKYTNAAFANTQGIPTGQSNFELQQQLQVRINGQVGRKVTVNVDFDDTKQDKKDISIVYKGDPDEVVQRAAFGDINLSLPQTEFAGYSKQVFGAEAELKYKALRGYVIGSRTKGESETKEFVGNVILQRLDIADTAYIRRRFYNYTKLNGQTGNFSVNISTIKLYLDTQDIIRPPASFVFQGAADASQLRGAVPYPNGHFTLLSQGTDYTVDPTIGLITLRNVLASNAVLAIDYPGLPNQGVPKILKYDESTVTSIPVTEDLTHYSIGTTKIVRDDGQGNFVMQVLDLTRKNVGPTSGVNVQYLPNNAGQIVMDFEQGTFYLKQRLDQANPTLYSPIYNTTPVHNLTFFVEFRSRLKTYTLRPNIVLNSEHITLNGRVLTRDVDYFIDYESGFITFFNEDQITQDSRIVATYDFSPFGIAGAQEDTLVGERTELSMYPVAPILAQSSIGSTVLYDFAPKQTAAPDIRQTVGSFLLTEADVHFKDLMFNPLPLLKTSFAAEGARSVRNPNTFGKALIDNMEGIQDDTSVGLSKLNWQISSNPKFSTGTVTFANAIGVVHADNEANDNLTNDLVRTLDINPSASALPGDQLQVLNIDYNLSASPEASIATVLSPSGIDFSKKLYLEMWVQGDGTVGKSNETQTQINVTLGQINEDVDGTHGGDYTDNTGFHPRGDNTPRTEDLNHNNTLDIGEDVGFTFVNPDNTTTKIGATNLRLDSEDLDRNGVMDAENLSVGGSFGYANPDPTQGIDLNGNRDNRVDYSGWKFVRVPLNITSTATINGQWSAIKELRFSLLRGAGAGRQGRIRIAKISVVGNRWLANNVNVFGSTITAKAINNEDDANYSSPTGFADFDALNQVNTALSGPQPTKRKEQSLAINYTLAPGSTGTVTSVTISPMDFSIYGTLQFFVTKNPAASTSPTDQGDFVFRAGSDSDYWEFKIPVAQLPNNSPGNQWTELKIKQLTEGSNQRASLWVSGVLNGFAHSVGHPILTSVSQMSFGVVNSSNSIANATNEIWIDELHAADVITRTGNAARLTSAFEVFGWGKLDLGMRDMDRNFETFTSAITNQDRHEETADLALTRLQFFPMKFSALKRRTITPNVTTESNSTLVSVLQEGRIDETAFSGTGVLQIPKLPKLGLLYDTDRVHTQELFRTDKTDHYGLTADYTVPGQHVLLPKTVQLGYKMTKLGLDFTPDAFTTATDPFQVSNTKDNTQDITARLSFQPLPGFTFNPNFLRSTTREYKEVAATGTVTQDQIDQLRNGYDKAKTQTLGLDGVMNFTRWFAPRVRYSVTNRETFGIPLVSSATAFNTKSVDRTATGETAWDFAWRDFSHKIVPLQSLNVVSSYLIEDGDTYDNVDASKDSLWSVWLRNGLNGGTRQNLTLRDTFRSTQRWSPFDWAHDWSGPLQPLRTLSMTSTFTDTKQRQETTGTPSKILTKIYPDLILSLTQTEYFFRAQNWMSNSQMNIKTQYKTVDTVDTSLEKATSNGGDWRFTVFKKFDLFFTYTRTTDNLFDRINNVVSNNANGEILGAQLGFNIGKWRLTPKYDQTKQTAVNSSGLLTTDLTTRTPALQAYADLFLPAGLRLPFGDLVVFSNRIRTTSTISLAQKRSSLNALQDNTDTYTLTTSEDYEMTSNVRLKVGGSYAYTRNKVSADANFYSYELNTLLTIQF